VKWNLPPTFRCEECGAIVKEMQSAWETDSRDVRQRLRQVAASSGRDISQFSIDWIRSVIQLPDDEMQVLLKSHYPRVAAARQKQTVHETTTGHSVSVHGSWSLMPPGSGYFLR